MSIKVLGWSLSVALLSVTFLQGREAAGKAPIESRAPMAVWDTGRPSLDPLSPESLAAKSGWSPVAQERKAFQGDAVVTNGRILAVFRKQSAAVEIHSGDESGVLRFRCVLQAADGSATRLVRVGLVENGKGRACLEASYQTAKGTSLAAKFSIKKGDVA